MVCLVALTRGGCTAKTTMHAGLSDPYVIIRVLPEHKAIKPRQSNRLNETLNPVFNQTFELYVDKCPSAKTRLGRYLCRFSCSKMMGVPVEDCMMQFAFYDFDFIGGHDYIGEVIVPLRYVYDHLACSLYARLMVSCCLLDLLVVSLCRVSRRGMFGR